MEYTKVEVINISKIYCKVEMEIKDFINISAFTFKQKDKKIDSAKRTLDGIRNYRKLPDEIKELFSKDKSSFISKVDEIEKLCIETLK